jgi:hypothetical protein
VGDPIAVRAAAEEGRDLGDAIGDRFASHGCRWNLGCAQGMTGDVVGAVAQLREVIAEADAAHDVYWGCCALFMQALMLANHGDPSAARDAANAAVEAAAELGGFFPGLAYAGLTVATLAGGDVAAAEDAIAAALPHLSLQPKMAAIWIVYATQAALARGDLTAARRLADDAVAATSGFHLSLALTTRAGVAIAQGESEQAGRDAHDALVSPLRKLSSASPHSPSAPAVSVKRRGCSAPQTLSGNRHKAFRLTAHCANPPHPRLHQTRPHLARAARPRGWPPQLS